MAFAPTLLDHLRITYSPDSPDSAAGFDELFEQILDGELLVLDDFGTDAVMDELEERLGSHRASWTGRWSSGCPSTLPTTATCGDERTVAAATAPGFQGALSGAVSLSDVFPLPQRTRNPSLGH